MVIQPLPDRGKHSLELGEIHHPTGVGIHFTGHFQTHHKRMPMQTAALMALRHVGQTVCGFKLKIFKQRGCHYYGLIDSKTAA